MVKISEGCLKGTMKWSSDLNSKVEISWLVIFGCVLS